MKAMASKSRLGSRGTPEQSRAAILKAAIGEFSREGLAGARTDAIARDAHVNKALLYYYFEDKEALYSAALDQVFSGLHERVQGALSQPLPPRERILAYVGAHFDYIASNPLYPRIVQSEMMHSGQSGRGHLERIVKQYFRPLFLRLSDLLKEGLASGDFRAVNPWHFIPSMISVIVFHFNTAPVLRVMTGRDPMDPELLKERRAAVLEFISAALFSAPQGGRP
jgi:TetR/AcrR family transcriptional regulator